MGFSNLSSCEVVSVMQVTILDCLKFIPTVDAMCAGKFPDLEISGTYKHGTYTSRTHVRRGDLMYFIR